MTPSQSLSLAAAAAAGKSKVAVIIKSEVEEVNGDCVETEETPNLIRKNKWEDGGWEKEDDNPFGHKVDVLGCGEDTEVVEPEKNDDPDATETENSSSFGNTFSGSDDEVRLSSSDMEVDSQFSIENAELSVMDGDGRLFKKKKVTANWRRFISPLMWRCKWLELQMHELQSQASIYDKELAGYKREKQLQSKMIELDDSVSRSVPLTFQSHKNRAMKKRKRKRNEETLDISVYMANHNIFSYYENKKSETDGHSIDDGGGNQVVENMKGTDDHEWLDFKDSDSSLEQSLINIDELRTRVLKLKSHLNMVMCRISRDVSLTTANIFHGEEPYSYAQSQCYPPGNNGDVLPCHHTSEYDLEEIGVPESAVSSYGDAADLDIIESTTDTLSAVEIHPLNQHHVGVSCMDIAEEILITNQAADEGLQNFEVSVVGDGSQVVKEEAQSCSEDESTTPNVMIPEPGPLNESSSMQQEPVLKSCYTGKKRGRKPKKKKKRGGSVASYKSERLKKLRLS